MLYFGGGTPLILDLEVDFLSMVTGILSGYRSSAFQVIVWSSVFIYFLQEPPKKIRDILRKENFERRLVYKVQYSLPSSAIQPSKKDNKSTKKGQTHKKRAKEARFLCVCINAGYSAGNDCSDTHARIFSVDIFCPLVQAAASDCARASASVSLIKLR